MLDLRNRTGAGSVSAMMNTAPAEIRDLVLSRILRDHTFELTHLDGASIVRPADGRWAHTRAVLQAFYTVEELPNRGGFQISADQFA